MKTTPLLFLTLASVLLSGCSAGRPVAVTPVAATAGYAAKEPIATSLFPSDQAVLGDEAVARILSSKVELPAKAKLALMKFPDRTPGGYYSHDEEYLKLQQSQVDTLTKALLASDQIAEVVPLPTLMTPAQVSIPVLREAAVRMQADMLLVFRVGSDTYWKYRVFAKDKVKSYSTCELVLLDLRTGLVPFTRVVSREQLEVKQPSDLDVSETMRRAEQTAAVDALNEAAAALVGYIKVVPQKTP